MVYAHILFTNGFFEPKSPIFLDIIKKIAKMHGTYFEQFCKATTMFQLGQHRNTDWVNL